jgi:hypothetical protein
MTLLELAERVEAAEGPDRESDLDIAQAVGLRPRHLKFIPGGSDLAWDAESGGCGFKIEPYTASLDAALTLVPEGWSVKLYAHPDGECHAEVYRLGEIIEAGDGTLMRPYAAGCFPQEAGPSATPALALAAACLRARSTMEGLS